LKRPLMKTQIIKFSINNELDIVLAHRRAIQLCELTGISLSDKTRFTTAISEICRNCLEFAKEGDIAFSIEEANNNYSIEGVIEDRGPGIKKLEEILKRQSTNSNIRGVGIIHARKLADYFNIDSSPAGTRVLLAMKVPPKHPPINNIIIKGWSQHFEKNLPVSPYEEIKKQNMQLLDVTEELKLKQIQAESQLEEIRALNGQLKKANKELEDFTYTISHDLKSPINNIELLTSLLNKSEDTEKNKTFVKAIETSIVKLKHTINGLVEIIEVQNTEKNIISTVLFETALEWSKEQYQEEIDSCHATIESNFKIESFRYYEAYLNSIMQNLINNAIKYRDDSRSPVIEVSTVKQDDFCLLTIKDNGTGMDLSRVGPNLFKPFTRFSKGTEGKGIGLHLVRSMVERNGGKVEVESEVGKGTTFKIFLKEY
jgi:signal transduction histidine kinase